MKKRILTGIQSSGVPHLGNILGAIIPSIKLSQDKDVQSLFFIADMHSLTSIKDRELIKKNTYSVASAWISFGFDATTNIFYRQSDIPEVTELTWYLNCVTPFPMLSNAHSFKDKSSRSKLSDVNVGLFDYPVLMASDIILYSPDIVPVGKDQIQHLEIAKDIAGNFNRIFGETFTIPNIKTDENIMVIPGTDGQKMSKSYKNTIDIFLSEKELKKQILKIVTDSTSMEEPKEYKTCNVYKLYKLLAEDKKIKEMENNYKSGNYGYGNAKTELFELIIEKFKVQRENYNRLMKDTNFIEQELEKGAAKARDIALDKLEEVRNKIGFAKYKKI